MSYSARFYVDPIEIPSPVFSFVDQQIDTLPKGFSSISPEVQKLFKALIEEGKFRGGSTGLRATCFKLAAKVSDLSLSNPYSRDFIQFVKYQRILSVLSNQRIENQPFRYFVEALFEHNEKKAEVYIEWGVPLEETWRGLSTLEWARYYHCDQVTSLILTRQLLKAIQEDNSQAIVDLTKEKASVNTAFIKEGKSYPSIAWYFIESQDIQGFFRCLSLGVSIEVRGDHERDMLEAVLKLGWEEIALEFISRQCALKQEHLFLALDMKSIRVMAALLEKGLNVNSLNAKGQSLLHLLCKLSFDDVKMFFFLLAHYHVDVNLPDKKGRTPFYYAVAYGDVKTVHLFSTFRAVFRCPRWPQRSPFLTAVRKENWPVALYFMRELKEVDVVDEESGFTLFATVLNTRNEKYALKFLKKNPSLSFFPGESSPVLSYLNLALYNHLNAVTRKILKQISEVIVEGKEGLELYEELVEMMKDSADSKLIKAFNKVQFVFKAST